jgi:hypothetical protein
MKETTMATAESKITTDHNVIRKWAEERQGTPATVKSTGDAEHPGLLRIDFPGYSGEGRLEHISWDEFFRKFDESGLAFLYQDKLKGGETSRFFKFVRRDGHTKH